MPWSHLYHLGDLRLTLSTGIAIAAWLLAARAWRAACGWIILFGLALTVVAATKIAFLGWATGWPALGFKAASGHAAGFAAAFPTLCWLLARRCAPAARMAATLAMLALGAAVAVALVRAGEHTVAEAAAGWLIGAAACLGTIRLAADVPAPANAAALACAAFAFLATVRFLNSVSVGYWMIKVALALSGNPYPYPWDSC